MEASLSSQDEKDRGGVVVGTSEKPVCWSKVRNGESGLRRRQEDRLYKVLKAA